MLKYQKLLWVTGLMFLFGAAAFAADEINVNGVDRYSANESVTVQSTITGNGTADGRFIITGGDAVNNDSDVTVTSNGGTRGILVIDGAGSRYSNNNSGETVFTTGGGSVGGMLQIDNNGEFINGGTVRFLEGSNFSITTGTVLNHNDMYVHTGMEGNSALNLLMATSQTSNGYMFIEGSSSLFNGADFNHTLSNSASAVGSYFVFQTAGDFEKNINLYGANMSIEAESAGAGTALTFKGSVTANNITVTGREATFLGAVTTGYSGSTGLFTVASGATANFTGTGSSFTAGNMTNKGALNFLSGGTYTSSGLLTNSGTLVFGNGSSIQGSGAITNSGTATFQNGSSHQSSGVITNTGTFTFESGSIHQGSGAIANSGSFYFKNGSTYQGTGAITNTGTLTFETNSTYATTAGAVTSNGGTLNYSSGTVNLAGANGLFAKTTLNGATLNVTDSATVTGNLALAAADAASTVRITHGATFAGMDVKNATLYVSGTQQETLFNGQVVAPKIIVENRGARFAGDVDGGLDVVSTAFFTSTSSFNKNHDITVRTGGVLTNESMDLQIRTGRTLTNNGRVVNNAGGVMTNGGTVDNFGAFQNDGTYIVQGLFNNTGQFVNNGRFENQSTMGIVNSGNGVMRFNSGTTYISGGATLIQNTATIHASAQMTNTDLHDLMGDISMDAIGAKGGIFNLFTEGNATLTGSYSFGNTTTGSVANIDAGNYAITFADNSEFDAQNTAINIVGGRVVVKDDVSFKTAADFTVKSGAQFDFTDGNGYVSEIQAANVVVADNGSIDVGTNNTLNIVGNLNTDSQGVVNIGDSGLVHVTGTAGIANGGAVYLGEKAELRVDGNISFAGGSTVSITATDSNISRVVSVNGSIAVASPTEVIFIGTRDQIVNKYFMESLTSSVDYQNLYNALYTFTVRKNGTGGDQVYVSGIRSVIDMMAEAFGGYEYLSVNKYNGGTYTDQILATKWGANNADLANYLQQAASPSLGAARSYTAFGQLYGEYAAYASTPLLANAGTFRDAIKRHMYRSPYSLACADPCAPNPCDNSCGETLSVSGVSSVATNRIWAGGFGDWERQNNDKRLHGYDLNSSGVILGYDYDLDGLVLGVAGAYNYGTLKVNDLDTKFRSDMFSLGVYGGYTHESGVYVNATLGYMLGWNDYDVKMALGGKKHGDYDNHAFTGALEVGYQAELAGGYYLIPSVGLSYTHLRQDDWVETLHAGSTPLIANVFDHSRHNVLDVPLSLAVGKEYVCEGFTVRPEVRGSWIYHAKGTKNRIHTGYNGTTQRTTMYAIDRATGTGVVGGGFTARFDSGISVALNYDYEFSDRYRNHNLTGSLSLAF